MSKEFLNRYIIEVGGIHKVILAAVSLVVMLILAGVEIGKAMQGRV